MDGCTTIARSGSAALLSAGAVGWALGARVSGVGRHGLLVLVSAFPYAATSVSWASDMISERESRHDDDVDSVDPAQHNVGTTVCF